MAKRIRPEKCAFFYRKSKVGDFCLCSKDEPQKRCNGVCELYMGKQEFEQLLANEIENDKKEKE